jgi:hypothetical protein
MIPPIGDISANKMINTKIWVKVNPDLAKAPPRETAAAVLWIMIPAAN